MAPNTPPTPTPEIPKNDPPPEQQDAPKEIDLPTNLPSREPPQNRVLPKGTGQ